MVEQFAQFMAKRLAMGYPVKYLRPGDWAEEKKGRVRRGRKLRKKLA